MESKQQILNMLTIDLEDWFHQNYSGLPAESSISTVERNTSELLELLESFEVKATFFCLSQIAQRHPTLVKRIHSFGHEISSHGHNHLLAYTQSEKEFRKDIKCSKMILEDVIGDRIRGYRAPSWSINSTNLWSLEIVEELGFLYDSSIFPAKTFLYGIKNAPRFPYVPKVCGKQLSIIEVPPSTFRIFGQNIAFGGGFYLRFLPLAIQFLFCKFINTQAHPFLVYIHPREIDPCQPRLVLPVKARFIHYWGISKTKAKLERFLRRFSFGSIQEVLANLNEGELPTIELYDL